ncbi:MAG: DNA alkylation repair protein [Spirochaetales bacterium]|nr:DNA alkylation repair protein [Spirochaetales bacterium]
MMTKQEIVKKLTSVLLNYTQDNIEHIAGEIEKLWLQSDDLRSTRLVKEELKEKLHTSGVSLDVLKNMGKTTGKYAKGKENTFLPLAARLWENHGREGRIITAYLLGEIVLALPEPVFALSRTLALSTISWEDADNMIMSIEPAIRKAPDIYFPWLDEWFTDSCKWVRRIAITITGRLSMKRHDYTGLCLDKILINIKDEDIDVRRATSFAIRLCTRGDVKQVVEFIKKNTGGTAYGKIWVFSDVIRSMAMKFLPEFKGLLPLYEKWRIQLTDSKSIKSLEAAIKLLKQL